MMNINFIKPKKGAMEMSMGTMVTIVLAVTLLVLGIFFVKQIFGAGTGAIDAIDAEVQSEIQKLFAEEGREIAIFPTSRRIELRQGDSGGGFAFSVRNIGAEKATYTFETRAIDASNCPGVSEEDATGWVMGRTGTVENLASGAMLDARLVTFNIPNTAPLCIIEYELTIKREKEGTEETRAAPNLFLKIK